MDSTPSEATKSTSLTINRRTRRRADRPATTDQFQLAGAAYVLLDFWFALDNVGPHDALAYLLGDPRELDPKLSAISRVARRWIRQHRSFRAGDAELVARIAEREGPQS